MFLCIFWGLLGWKPFSLFRNLGSSFCLLSLPLLPSPEASEGWNAHTINAAHQLERGSKQHNGRPSARETVIAGSCSKPSYVQKIKQSGFHNLFTQWLIGDSLTDHLWYDTINRTTTADQISKLWSWSFNPMVNITRSRRKPKALMRGQPDSKRIELS